MKVGIRTWKLSSKQQKNKVVSLIIPDSYMQVFNICVDIVEILGRL
jgi:hypothetical protein